MYKTVPDQADIILVDRTNTEAAFIGTAIQPTHNYRKATQISRIGV
jgi:hypothetical protein